MTTEPTPAERTEALERQLHDAGHVHHDDVDAAIVAREYRLPAVTGVRNALSSLRTGMLIEVDGDAGTVRIIDEN